MMWDKYARCNGCKKIVAPENFSNVFFIPACPECGIDNDVEIVTARQVYKGKWYNPLTWFSYEWEIR